MSQRMIRFLFSVMIAVAAACSSRALADATTFRLYDDVGLFYNNPDGKDFTLSLEIRDINHIARGPSELLVKVYTPDGRLAVREVVPDDGVTSNLSSGQIIGWDHEGWYYATEYSRGLDPGVRWSAWSDPARLANMPVRKVSYAVKGNGQKGVYRVNLAGSPDLYITPTNDAGLAYGINGGPDWMHGHHEIYAKKFVCAPHGSSSLDLGIQELDIPYTRSVTVKTLDGKLIATASATRGMGKAHYECSAPGELDDKVLVVEVSPTIVRPRTGPIGDYLLDVNFGMPKEQRNWRGAPRVNAVLCDSPEDAKAIQNGAIYHDGKTFFQGYQVRMHDLIKKLSADDLKIPEGLPKKDGFISVGSHQTPLQFLNDKRIAGLKDPRPGTADIIMHSWGLHKNRNALNVALQEMLEGMMIVGPNDHVMHGRNLAYEMGTYSYFYHRPAWRILQQSDAPDHFKDAVREFAIQVGDRLAFCRGIEMVNGNSLSSLVQGMRYCVEATGDPLQKQLFETYWARLTTGGFGDRVGVGPSGGMQEGFGYDAHYGTYVLSGWQAGVADLNEQRFLKVLNGIRELYTYIGSMAPVRAHPWNSRTVGPPRGDVLSWSAPFEWKGHGGPDITGSVKDANEFFYARRPMYYALNYAGRITPSWLGEGFHGQVGYGGGVLAQLHVIGKGPILASNLAADYGGGMHISNWRNFHIHSLVGTTADGQFIVTANSEPPFPRLDGKTLVLDAEVRQSSVHFYRTYTYGDTDITATVRLAESDAEKVFMSAGGPHGLRGFVTEAYEMIPYVVRKESPGKRQAPVSITKVLRIGPDGKPVGPVTPSPAQASAVLIDNNGYGVRIDFDKPRNVLLGNHETLMIQLVAPRGGKVEGEEAPAGEAAPAADADKPEAAESEGAEGAEGDEAALARGPRGATPAAAVSLAYRLTPYAGEAPNMAAGGVDAAAARAAGGAPAPPKPTFALRAIKPIDSPTGKAIAQALAEEKAYTFTGNGKSQGEIRLAIVGDKLALSAMLSDPEVKRAEPVWKGSCMEVFGAAPETNKITQLFLAPQVGDTPASGFIKGEGRAINGAAEILVFSQPAPGGYQLQALIPLKLLGVDPARPPMLLEFQIDASGGKPDKNTKKAPPMLYTALFGSRFAYENAANYARFELAK